MKFRALKNKKGFTLVELIVSLGLVVMLGVVIFYLTNSTVSLYKRNTDTATIQDQSRIIVQGLKNEMRSASGVTVTDSPVSLSAGQAAYFVSGGMLCRQEYGDTATPTFSTQEYDTLQVTFSFVPAFASDPAFPSDVDPVTVLHIAVSIEGRLREETDVFLLNSAVSGATSGSAVVFTPVQ